MLQGGDERETAERAVVYEFHGHDGRVVRPVLPGVEPEHEIRGGGIRTRMLLRQQFAYVGGDDERE